ncbi:MerR family transcriptional regulator [Streptomyces hoynatensis]|uniref:MerR family transcriptional regulator n=1 Tax=Streptomyces hoynatensis TaxID=1141874 RepID=A0A3A9YPJ9_9ACTN|nr:MerR family transcriptional regulator [Streptomyces hoynatensis]RKN37087.1 MerR family transcriptional regulator [Streptomyces hoynatensis]
MRIGELARRAGTTTRTLRYYESRGLLAARRGENGYRSYDEEDLRLLRQIKTLQDFGFELEETRPFVECLRSGQPEGDACPASIETYRRKLAELDACLARLQDVRERLRVQLARAERRSHGPAGAAGAPRGGAAAPEPRCELAGPAPAVTEEGARPWT